MTLLEAVAAVLVLSISVPPTLALLTDAASTRADSIATTRATLYAQAVMEQVIADVCSPDEALGFEALAEDTVYNAGLDARLADIAAGYAPFRLTHAVVIGELADETGTPSGDAIADVYRRIRVEITFLTSGGSQTLVIEHLLTEAGA